MQGYHTGKIYKRPLPGVIDKAAILAEAPQIVARAIARGLARFESQKVVVRQANAFPREGRHLTDAEKAKLVAMHRSGMGRKQIRTQTGVSRNAIARAIKEAAI